MPAFASYVVLCVVAPETFFLPYPYPNTYLLLLSMSLVQNKLFCILIFFFLTIGARGSHFFTKDFHLHRNNVCRGFSDVKKDQFRKA